MRHLIIFYLLLVSLLSAADKAILFDDAQELLHWYDEQSDDAETVVESHKTSILSLPDAVIVQEDEKEMIEDSYLDSLPFATIVEEEIDKETIQKDTPKVHEDKNKTVVTPYKQEEDSKKSTHDSYLDSLPFATIVKEEKTESNDKELIQQDAPKVHEDKNNTVAETYKEKNSTKSTHDSYLDSLPFATIVEEEKIKSIDKELIQQDAPKVHEDKNNTVAETYKEENSTKSTHDSYLDSLPFATIEEEEKTENIDKELIQQDTQKVHEDKNETVITRYEQEINTTEPIIITNNFGASELLNNLEIREVSIKENIDFWKLLDLTLVNSTALILKNHDIRITRENLGLVRSEYYPNLSLSYVGEYYHGYDRGGSSATIGGSFYPGIKQFRDSIALSLNYEIYRFGATDLKVKMSEKDIEIVKSELSIQEEDISKELLSYYASSLRAQNVIKYNSKIKLIQEEVIGKKLRLFDVGKITKMEIAKDQLTLASLEKEISNQKLNFLKAIKNIQILSNLTIDSSTIEFAMLEPKNMKIKTFEESSVAKNLKLKLEKKLQELKLIQKDYMPTLYASSGYRYYGSDGNFFGAIENIEKNSWDVGVTLKWDIFNGYKTDKTVEKSKLEVKKLVDQYRLAKIDFQAQEKRREMLKQSIDKILKIESEIFDQTCQQEEILIRLESAGQISSIQINHIEISKIQSELNFRLSVLDRVYESISAELIN